MTATGDVYLHDGGIEVDAKRITSNLDTQNSEMDDAIYNMTCQPGRGDATQSSRPM